MVFSSLVFLCLFLPAFLALYWAAPVRWRNGVALAGSLLFYAWGAPRFVGVLIFSSMIDFYASRPMAAAPPGSRARRGWLILGVTTNLSVFLYAKYMNFFVGQLNHIVTAAGASAFSWQDIALPIGISFFTFQKLSYLVDVYRGIVQPARSAPTYLLYVALFPQLIAGPIVRYHDVARQLVARSHTAERMCDGIWRFCLGLGRKVLIANAMGELADTVFAMPPGQLSTGAAWLGALAYSFQIYHDFSGYSDMAIGLGRMMGFEFLENFNAPYISRSFTEFWRRWHISLSNWMREYLYVPLGGNRVTPGRRYVNLWIVFLLSGFWHGAAWSFVAWGAYHGLFLTLDKLVRPRLRRPPPAAIAIPSTFVLVTLGWVLFRADSLSHAGAFWAAMFGMGADPAAASTPGLAGLLTPSRAIILGVAVIAACLPLFWKTRVCAPTTPDAPVSRRPHTPLGLIVRFAAAGIVVIGSLMSLVNGGFNPFIYFRF